MGPDLPIRPPRAQTQVLPDASRSQFFDRTITAPPGICPPLIGEKLTILLIIFCKNYTIVSLDLVNFLILLKNLYGTIIA